MRLTVLGGSAAGPNPGAGCSGYLVDSGPRRVVLDLGPGTLPELRRHCDIRRLDAVVVSHLHLDHTLDLLALRWALAYSPGRLPSPVPLWLPPGGLDFLERAAAVYAEPRDIRTFFTETLRPREYDPVQILDLGEGLCLSFLRTNHFIPCWGMRATTGEPASDLVYTADTGPMPGFASFAAGAALVVAEATAAGPDAGPAENRGHLTPEEAAAIARDADAAALLLTHLWREHGFDQVRRRAAAVFNGRIELARPGVVIEWP